VVVGFFLVRATSFIQVIIIIFQIIGDILIYVRVVGKINTFHTNETSLNYEF